MKSLAYNIKKYRKARGFTQRELANLISRPVYKVMRWESNNAIPDAYELRAIMQVLSILNIDTLFQPDPGQVFSLHFQNLFNTHLRRKKISISTVSKRINIQQDRLMQFRDGEAVPTSSELHILSRYLNFNFENLFFLTNKQFVS